MYKLQGAGEFPMCKLQGAGEFPRCKLRGAMSSQGLNLRARREERGGGEQPVVHVAPREDAPVEHEGVVGIGGELHDPWGGRGIHFLGGNGMLWEVFHPYP